MTVYLDTSALVPIHVEEPGSPALARMIGALDSLPTVSDFAAGEFGSVVSRYVRMDLITPAQGDKILDDFDHWMADSADVVQINREDIRRASQIVRRFDLKLRFPDALHVAICANRALTLATGDRQMVVAAVRLGIEIMDMTES